MEFIKQLLGGVIGGAIGAAIWAGVVHLTGYEIGFVACFVGILTGIGVAMVSPARGMESGVLAGVLALGAIGVGKVSSVWLEMERFRAEAMSDESMVARLADEELEARVEAGEDFSDWYEYMDFEESAAVAEWYPPEVWEAAEREWFMMTGPQREEMRAGVDAEHAAFAPIALIIGTLVSLGIFDFLWVALGVSSAYKIASSSNEQGSREMGFEHAVAEPARAEAPAGAPQAPAPAGAPARTPMGMGAAETSHPLLKMGMQQSAAQPTGKPMRKLSDPGPAPESEDQSQAA